MEAKHEKIRKKEFQNKFKQYEDSPVVLLIEGRNGYIKGGYFGRDLLMGSKWREVILNEEGSEESVIEELVEEPVEEVKVLKCEVCKVEPIKWKITVEESIGHVVKKVCQACKKKFKIANSCLYDPKEEELSYNPNI